MTIEQMQKEAWQNSEDHGFHALPEHSNTPTRLMLIVSEVAEAMEEDRNGNPVLYYRGDGKPEGIAAELADIIIRVGDLAGCLGIDLTEAVTKKMAYNRTRPVLHGGKRY